MASNMSTFSNAATSSSGRTGQEGLGLGLGHARGKVKMFSDGSSNVSSYSEQNQLGQQHRILVGGGPETSPTLPPLGEQGEANGHAAYRSYPMRGLPAVQQSQQGPGQVHMNKAYHSFRMSSDSSSGANLEEHPNEQAGRLVSQRGGGIPAGNTQVHPMTVEETQTQQQQLQQQNYQHQPLSVISLSHQSSGLPPSNYPSHCNPTLLNSHPRQQLQQHQYPPRLQQLQANFMLQGDQVHLQDQSSIWCQQQQPCHGPHSMPYLQQHQHKVWNTVFCQHMYVCITLLVAVV